MNAVIDRIVQYPNRWKITNADTQEVLGVFDFSPETGTIIQEGTKINKALFDSIATNLDEKVKAIGGDVSQTSETFTPATLKINLVSGETISVSMGKIYKWLADLKGLAFKESLSKSDVGLSNADNTSDVNKPISTATQTALDAKANDTAVVHNTANECFVHSNNDTAGTTWGDVCDLNFAARNYDTYADVWFDVFSMAPNSVSLPVKLGTLMLSVFRVGSTGLFALPRIHWDICNSTMNANNFVMIFKNTAPMDNKVSLYVKTLDRYQTVCFSLRHTSVSSVSSDVSISLHAVDNPTLTDLSGFANYSQYQSTIETLQNSITGNAATATRAADSDKLDGKHLTDTYVSHMASIVDTTSAAGTTWGKVCDYDFAGNYRQRNIVFDVTECYGLKAKHLGQLMLSAQSNLSITTAVVNVRVAWLECNSAVIPANFVAVANGTVLSLYVKTSTMQADGIVFRDINETDYYGADCLGDYNLYKVINPALTDMGTVVGTKTNSVVESLQNDITGNAATATKATQDGNGNIISQTYAKTADVGAKVSAIDYANTNASLGGLSIGNNSYKIITAGNAPATNSVAVGPGSASYVPAWVSFDSSTVDRTISVRSLDNIFVRGEAVNPAKGTQAGYAGGKTLKALLTLGTQQQAASNDSTIQASGHISVSISGLPANIIIEGVFSSNDNIIISGWYLNHNSPDAQHCSVYISLYNLQNIPDTVTAYLRYRVLPTLI